jgi:hypothetical protein
MRHSPGPPALLPADHDIPSQMPDKWGDAGINPTKVPQSRLAEESKILSRRQGPQALARPLVLKIATKTLLVIFIRAKNPEK